MDDRVAERLISDLISAPAKRYQVRDIIRAAQINPCETDVDALETGGPILIYKTMGKAMIVAGLDKLIHAWRDDPLAYIEVKVV